MRACRMENDLEVTELGNISGSTAKACYIISCHVICYNEGGNATEFNRIETEEVEGSRGKRLGMKRETMQCNSIQLHFISFH